MWVLNIRLDSSTQFLGSLAMKHGVSMTGYPLSHWKDKNWLYVMAAGFMFGEEKNKGALVREIRRDDRCKNLEIKNDFVIITMKQPLYSEPVYDPRIIRTKPVLVSESGKHIWYLASFDRKVLEKVLHFAEKHNGGRVLKFKQEKINNISITRIIPDLTSNQKKALEIAINNGYYEYPKKVKMETLSKKMGISYSTYQAHLKKAEGKIIPDVYKEL